MKFYGNIGIENLPKGQGTMYDSDDVMSFASGENEIIIYNANESGPLSYDISFSGATFVFSELLAVGASIAALMTFI